MPEKKVNCHNKIICHTISDGFINNCRERQKRRAMISEFTKEKVFWTRKMNLNLVNFIKSRPNIWNPKHPKYTSVYCRDKTYAEFASKYCNEFTGQAVKDRWTNIRSTYTNYLRKVKASRSKGDGEVYKVSWHLWEACSFLLKVTKLNKTEAIPNTDESMNITDKEDIINDEEYCSENLTDLNTTCENIANSIANVFKGMQNGILFNTENTQHEQVGNMVATKLSQMNSYNAAQVSSKIMEILLLYDGNNPANPNIFQIKSESCDKRSKMCFSPV